MIQWVSFQVLAKWLLYHIIRFDWSCSHGSDSVDAANHEIDLWFGKNELNNWTSASNSWIYE
jgi:hypothetical protein